MTRSPGTLVRAALGIAVSVVALAIALRGVDLARTAEVLRSAAPVWVATMLAFNVADVAFRGLRWQRLLAPIRHVPYPRMFGYLLIGYLANNVLPARLGELVRSHVLGEREGVSRTTTLGTVVVERVIDTTVVVAVATGAILVLSVRGLVADAVLVGLGFAALLVLGLATLLAAHRLPGVERAIRLAGRWPRVADLGAKLRGGLAVAGRPRTIGEAVG
ncbi:MAG TPA: lysylphosphatidylglycerol synthase transmembrane domain-containing protein, partial [Candidatus Limnocylindrales bacterium]|nr:lysylphosphatidylglycerol synthase transmembrane domain-containing protein [Candidatus Limnocylindrales bacterium]